MVDILVVVGSTTVAACVWGGIIGPWLDKHSSRSVFIKPSRSNGTDASALEDEDATLHHKI